MTNLQKFAIIEAMLTTDFFDKQIAKAKEQGYSFANAQLEELKKLIADKPADEQKSLLQGHIEKHEAKMAKLEKFSTQYQLAWSKKTIADNMLHYLNFHYGEKNEK